MGSKPKASHPVRNIRSAVHLAESISGSDEREAHRSSENYYERAFVAEGNLIEPLEGFGHEDYGASGTSTLPTATYKTESYLDSTDPGMMIRGAATLRLRASGWRTRISGYGGRVG